MTRHRLDRVYCLLIFLKIIVSAYGDVQDLLNLQHRRTHLQDEKFGDNDYSEYHDTDERERADEDANSNQVPLRNAESVGNVPLHEESSINFSSTLDSNIKWDKNWLAKTNLGQLSAVDIDQNGNIAIFCRKSRKWDDSSFDMSNKFDRNKGPIKENVIILFDKNGKKISEWGKNMFYMPHGLTIDLEGNYWLTDVAMHQVFKFNKEDIEMNLKFTKIEKQSRYNETTMLKPSMVLGVAFEPSDDDKSFCKPTGVAVTKSGDFFVSDGYCNSRVIKFNSKGEQILKIGRSWLPGYYKTPPVYAMLVPHAIALAEDLGYIFVADRENGRVLCYHAQNGSFHKEYKHPAVGTKVFSIAYAQKHLFIVNGHDIVDQFHIRGFVIDVQTSEILSQFGPNGDMKGPHDIAVSNDGTEIYVVELNLQKAYRFIQANSSKFPVKKNTSNVGIDTNQLTHLHESKLLGFDLGGESSEKSSTTTIVLTLIVSTIILIGLCVAVAAVLARCQKRGCLLAVRRKDYWESERKDNFKLSSLLESRQGKSVRLFGKRPNTRDFSKLNTEPETSEDELVNDSIKI